MSYNLTILSIFAQNKLNSLEAISVASYIFTAIYVIIVITFIKGWRSLIVYEPVKSIASTKVSIIVAARNEAHHIAKTIQDLLDQDYPAELVEIIIINDHSTDETAAIITSFAQDGVKLINLMEDNALNSYKKKAIQTAIGQSTGTLIITTDADCRMGKNWLKTIVSYYEENDYKMISSPVAYFDEQNLSKNAKR